MTLLAVLLMSEALAQAATTDPRTQIILALIATGGVVVGGFFGLLGVIVTVRGVGRKVDTAAGDIADVKASADTAAAELARNGGKSTKDQVVVTAGAVRKIERRLEAGDERFDALEQSVAEVSAGVALLLDAAGIHPDKEG